MIKKKFSDNFFLKIEKHEIFCTHNFDPEDCKLICALYYLIPKIKKTYFTVLVESNTKIIIPTIFFNFFLEINNNSLKK